MFQRRNCWRWLFFAVLCFIVFVRNGLLHHNKRSRKRREGISRSVPNFSGWKILYIVTTLAEFDNGRRQTVEGFDRFKEIMVPVLSESVKSMIKFGFDVDVVVISHYKMTRSHLLRQALPDTVGLQIWDQASPLGYQLEEKERVSIVNITRGLARQHRYVIKDKLQYYDFFVNFEDDMLIKGETVANYLEMSQELQRLRNIAPAEKKKKTNFGENSGWDEFYGVMNKRQLSQLIPGFIRVERLLDNSLLRKRNWKIEGLVPVTDRPDLDPEPCCDFLDQYPESDELYLWETNVRALGVRKMPLQSKFDWVLLQRGRRVFLPDIQNQRIIKVDEEIGDYWSGRNGYFEAGYERPDTKQFIYLNNQGGWMATRRQIWEWHTEFCQGGFLPPFELPHYNLDGLDLRNVEYWSGGLSIFTLEHGCNLQRIVSLDPERFARQLLYHTANNKQRHLTGARMVKFVNVNDFLGQMNTIRKNAQLEMNRRVTAIRGKLSK